MFKESCAGRRILDVRRASARRAEALSALLGGAASGDQPGGKFSFNLRV